MKLNIESIEDKTKLTTKGLVTMDDDDDGDFGYGSSEYPRHQTDGPGAWICVD